MAKKERMDEQANSFISKETVEKEKSVVNYIPEEKKLASSIICRSTYEVKAKTNIIVEKERMTEFELTNPNEKISVYSVFISSDLEKSGLECRSIVNLELSKKLFLRMSSAALSKGLKIKEGQTVVTLCPII